MIIVSEREYIAYDLDTAARLLCVSADFLSRATIRGDVVAHYAGDGATKPLYFREDLADWVNTLPTTKRGD